MSLRSSILSEGRGIFPVDVRQDLRDPRTILPAQTHLFDPRPIYTIEPLVRHDLLAASQIT